VDQQAPLAATIVAEQLTLGRPLTAQWVDDWIMIHMSNAKTVARAAAKRQHEQRMRDHPDERALFYQAEFCRYVDRFAEAGHALAQLQKDWPAGEPFPSRSQPSIWALRDLQRFLEQLMEIRPS